MELQFRLSRKFLVQSLTHVVGKCGREEGREGGREEGREGGREEGGEREKELWNTIINQTYINLYLPISFYFCKKNFSRDFTTF